MFKLTLKKYFPRFSNRFLLFTILLIYISISHVFLPVFHRGDFLFFSRWDRMSAPPQKLVYDITWDEGNTFLLRDYRLQAQSHINIYRFFNIIGNPFLKEELKKHFYSKLMGFCKCQKLEIFELQGSLSDHIIYKKQLKIVNREAL